MWDRKRIRIRMLAFHTNSSHLKLAACIFLFYTFGNKWMRATTWGQNEDRVIERERGKEWKRKKEWAQWTSDNYVQYGQSCQLTKTTNTKPSHSVCVLLNEIFASFADADWHACVVPSLSLNELNEFQDRMAIQWKHIVFVWWSRF